MQIINTPKQLQALRQNLINQSIGFVPTMGNLHDGHASLIRKSKQNNQITLLSIFTNPTQFNNPEDLKNYPRTLEKDLELAKNLGVDIVFLPTPENMYPDNYNYRISEYNISKILEGAARPGHFEGVLTVVLKFLIITQPTRIYMGKKDYQQYILIKNMVDAFFIPTQVIGVETTRNQNQLPLSSRNNLFSPEDFEKVQLFSKIFHNINLNPDQITQQLTQSGFEVEYITDFHDRRFGAVKYAGIRLIDNFELNLTGAES